MVLYPPTEVEFGVLMTIMIGCGKLMVHTNRGRQWRHCQQQDEQEDRNALSDEMVRGYIQNAGSHT